MNPDSRPAQPDSLHDILLLHPGDMGSALGALWRARGLRVHWLPHGRGAASHRRAEAAGLLPATLDDGLAHCGLVVSVCPPHAAGDVADTVLAHGFRGIYLDANAVAPATSRAIGERVQAAGARFVDGGIIGPPPAGAARARLYLSGPLASWLAPLLEQGGLRVRALDGPPWQASAVKMAFAAWNKGLIALLADVHALAEAHQVLEPLREEWAMLDPEVAERIRRMQASARKAWRWEGEMREIAATFAEAGLPSGFHEAAAEVYERLAPFKDAASAPEPAEIGHALLRRSPS